MAHPTPCLGGGALISVSLSLALLLFHSGPSLLEKLDSIDVPESGVDEPLRFPVQGKFRDMGIVIHGTNVSGAFSIGDKLVVCPTKVCLSRRRLWWCTCRPPPKPKAPTRARMRGGGGGGSTGGTRGTPTTGHRERGNDTSRSTGRSDGQNTATRRSTRRDERVTIQGLVKKQQPDGMSHRGGGTGGGGGGGSEWNFSDLSQISHTIFRPLCERKSRRSLAKELVVQ